LERQMGVVAHDKDPKAAAPAINTLTQRTPLRPPTSAKEFVALHGEAAQKAEAATGIPASFMVAQAAHETGWGKRNIRMNDGSNSFNLFGIKAGADWKGATTQVLTTEVINGEAKKVTQTFRAYSSYEESFADYARLMKTSPRYREVLASASNAQGFAQGLQRAGYATDPAYADKLGRVINTTLRLQRSLA
jgi:peptidoglycan hydrolase FlgJ